MKQFFTLLFVLCSLSLFAQNEFTVNQVKDSTQREPVIGKLSSGGYAVAFSSASAFNGKDIKLRLFDGNDIPQGGEIAVTARPGNQELPALAVDNNDRIAVVYATYTDTTSVFDIALRMYNSSGSSLINESIVNTTTRYTQYNPAVAFGPSGNFAVVWDSWFQDGGDRGVYCQRFNADGTKLGTEFLVNQSTAYSQARPKIKFFSDGSFIIIWESFKQDVTSPSGYGMYGRIYAQNGTASTAEFRINTTTADYQWLGDVEVLNNDNAIVTWTSWEQDGDDGGIFVQRFDKSGNKIGTETQINRTTAFYQWLPKVKKMGTSGAALIWSSWKQDSNREGVYCTFIDSLNRRTVFETRANTTVQSFQWEPDCIVTGANEILGVWSNYGVSGGDYDIIARRIRPDKPQAEIPFRSILHNAGNSSAELIVHAVDSSLFNNNIYSVQFDTTTRIDSSYMTIRNLTNNTIAVNRFPVDRGINQFYLSPVFNGAAVEVRPVFTLALDDKKSFFRKFSATNLSFLVQPPSAGARLLAPVDIVLVWGNCDTLTGGTYTTPLDTAIGINGQRTVVCPFRAVNMQTGAKVNLLIKEANATKNNKWNPGEEIVFLTPPPYQITGFNTHGQLATQLPSGSITMPQQGDSFYVFTQRPLTPADRYEFTLSKNLLNETDGIMNPFEFSVSANYPNPFNPSTTIRFTLSRKEDVSVTVYSLSGEKVAVLANGAFSEGKHELRWDATGLASGMYFAHLRAGGSVATLKLLLLK